MSPSTLSSRSRAAARCSPTWRANTVWVLGYDIAASFLALGVAWVFVRSINGNGLQKFVFLGIVLPFLLIRHVYKKLNTVQDLYTELGRSVRAA